MKTLLHFDGKISWVVLRREAGFPDILFPIAAPHLAKYADQRIPGRLPAATAAQAPISEIARAIQTVTR